MEIGYFHAHRCSQGGGTPRVRNTDCASFTPKCLSCGNPLGKPHTEYCEVRKGCGRYTVIHEDTCTTLTDDSPSRSSNADQTPPVEPVKVSVPTSGVKDDDLKLQYHLLPNRAIQEVVGVLMYGKEKYAENNWMKVEDPFVRYFNAALRHLWDSRHEDYDPETGFSHYAHAICCILFMLALKVSPAFDYEVLRTAMAKGRETRAKRGAKT